MPGRAGSPRAADRVRRGELDVDRAGDARSDEIGRLGDAFNAMARSLEQSRGELESQNTELEMQAIELEERQAELDRGRRRGPRAARRARGAPRASCAEEKRRAELLRRLRRPARRPRAGAERWRAIALTTLVEAAGADVGVLYAADWRDDGALDARRGRTGSIPPRWPSTRCAGGEGAAARAVARARRRARRRAERGAARAHGLGGRARRCAGRCTCRCGHGERAVGVADAGRRSAEAAFDAARGADRCSGWPAQAAVALAEAGALAQRNWLSQVNAAVLDCVREGIALVGLDHELVFANAAMEALAERLAMPIGAAIGARGARPRDCVAVDPEAYFAQWEAILADTDEPTADELERRPASCSSATRRRSTTTTGARIGRLVVLRDVTREREVERLKSDLMATVSHELRTPLASVLGYAELLRTRRLEPAMRDEILGTVHREAKRLSALIDDFLDLQTIEQDRLVLAREPFSVDELLAEQVRTFRARASAHQLELALGAGRRVRAAATARGSRRSSRTCSSNAIKYSPDGGAVRGRRAARGLEVLVLGRPTTGSASRPARAAARVREVLPRRSAPDAARGRHRPRAWRWRTRSSSPTAAGWGSRASRARARASGSRCPRPESPTTTAPNCVAETAYMCSFCPMRALACWT